MEMPALMVFLNHVRQHENVSFSTFLWILFGNNVYLQSKQIGRIVVLSAAWSEKLFGISRKA